MYMPCGPDSAQTKLRNKLRGWISFLSKLSGELRCLTRNRPTPLRCSMFGLAAGCAFERIRRLCFGGFYSEMASGVLDESARPRSAPGENSPALLALGS